jgi:xanthine dehydrogenase accessory factor
VSLDLPSLKAAVEAHGVVVRVLVVAVAGSVPREAGASMLVWRDGEEGTIGGGELENQALREARGMLAARSEPFVRTVPAGPALGQCCGGSVTLAWERFDTGTLPGRPALSAAARRDLAPRPGLSPAGDAAAGAGRVAAGGGSGAGAAALGLGAGHVGRAIVGVLAPWPGVAVTWVDLSRDRFRGEVPAGVTAVPAASPRRWCRSRRPTRTTSS